MARQRPKWSDAIAAFVPGDLPRGMTVAGAATGALSLSEALGIVPYGLEALGAMRLEKGHVVGNELNGTTTAANLGFGRMMTQHVTSAAFSPMLGQWIGLALLIRGRERIGERMRVYHPVRNGDYEADIVDPVFFDPEGTRLRA